MRKIGGILVILISIIFDLMILTLITISFIVHWLLGLLIVTFIYIEESDREAKRKRANLFHFWNPKNIKQFLK